MECQGVKSLKLFKIKFWNFFENLTIFYINNILTVFDFKNIFIFKIQNYHPLQNGRIHKTTERCENVTQSDDIQRFVLKWWIFQSAFSTPTLIYPFWSLSQLSTKQNYRKSYELSQFTVEWVVKKKSCCNFPMPHWSRLHDR